MSTREFFLLKLFIDDAARAAYLAKDEAQKRAYLTEDLATADVFSLLEQSHAWRGPKPSLDTIEWFGSEADLCEVMRRLRDQLSLPEGAPLRAILSKNTVFTFDAAEWSYAGFKGGAEPGLLQTAWMMQRKDGRWFFVGVHASDTEHNVAQGSVVRQARNAIDLLTEEP